jgi:two-component system, cell cycle response regulator
VKILIADDSIVSRHLLDSTLKKWGYEVVLASDGNQAWEVLSAPDAPALAILDWMMPGMTGLEVCRRVRQRGREPYTYILLLTSKSLREDLIEGMESGADDYILKPFDQHELNVRVRAGTRLVELHTELVATREAMREQATKDALTHIWNRASILDMLERELARSTRELGPVGVILLDLDHFKQINDNYGHFAGDAVLQEAALRMLNSIRTYDSIGRYGGEEFLILLPGCDDRSTFAQAERLRTHMAQEPISVSNAELIVTGSFGCTSALPGRQTTAEALIRKADEALYLAKRQGRNRVELLSSALVPSNRPGLVPA